MSNKITKILFYLLIVYTLLGVVVLPFILKPQLIGIVEKETKTEAGIGSVSFNPFLFKLKLSDIKLNDLHKKPLFKCKRILVDVDLYSLFFSALHLHLLEIDQAKIYLVHEKDKSINFLNIIKQKAQSDTDADKASSAQLPRVIVDTISIKDAALYFTDYTRNDVYKFDLKNMGLKIKNIDTKENNSTNGALRFYASFGDEGFVDFKAHVKGYEPLRVAGSLDFQANKLYTEWRYFKEYLNIEVADGTLHTYLDYDFDLSDLNATKITNAVVAINNLRIKPKERARDIFTLKHFALNKITMYPLRNNIYISDIGVDDLYLHVKRQKDKSIDWNHYIEINSGKTQKKNGAPLNLFVKQFSLKNANMAFVDNSLNKSVSNSIDKLNLQLLDLNASANSLMQYALDFQVNKQGLVQAEGQLQHTPLKEEGDFNISQISLEEITPYLQQSTYLDVEEGYFSATGKIRYEKSKKNADLYVNGSAALSSFFIYNSLEKKLLFSLNRLDINDYTFELMPNRFHINGIDVNAFYVDAEIDKNKVLNFSQLLKETNSTKEQNKQRVKGKSQSFPVKIDKIKVASGSARFQDYSIPIKFKTDIHNLNGVIYSVTNMKGENTLVNLDGEIDKYGSTKIKGSLQSQNPKKFTDITMNFKNLDLSAMSGYSASFAGYKIDSGKLFLDLGYNIVNSKLHGSNKVVIKKIKFGDEVEDENATHLPLGFVIALLEDENGVIDIDMPVEGDVDKPDFKYGKLVWNTFSNLVTQAVTAPFRFLGAMLGMDTKELDSVAFESGESKISPMQREKLDKLAVVMRKRPKLILKVHGVYDKRSDKKALQREKLIALVLQKSGLKNKKEHQSAMTLDMLEEIYSERGDKKVLKELQNSLAREYKDDELKIVYRKELIAKCIALMKVTKSELQTLASTRAKNIIEYLQNEKKVVKERLQAGALQQNPTQNGFITLNLELAIK